MGLFRISRKLQPSQVTYKFSQQQGNKNAYTKKERKLGGLIPCQKRRFSSSCGSATVARHESTPSDLPTLSNCGLSSVHGILQATILEWVAMPSSRRSSRPRGWAHISRSAGGFFTHWAHLEGPVYYYFTVIIFPYGYVIKHYYLPFRISFDVPELKCGS